jgi:RHH-type rel operon transcriptional repressor/antitoxin RelB
MLAVRLAEEIEFRLNRLAKVTGRTKTYYIREAIINQLEDMEDYYLGMETLERIRKGEEKIYSSKEVRHELGLDD